MGPLSGDLRKRGGFGGLRGKHELSCGSAAVRGELVRADFLVVDAVRPNQSPGEQIPC